MRYLMVVVLIFAFYISQCQQMDEHKTRRMRMVDEQLVLRGISNRQTLEAMRTVPRHLFVPQQYQHLAYGDNPLSIGMGQTISQPYIVAYMTEAVKPKKGKKALEIGTGSGYQAAILAEIVDSVFTIEIVKELAQQAQATIKSLGYKNILVKCGDGYTGWPQHGPFDIIVVTAAPDHIPEPLIEQLADGGRMIIPVGRQNEIQELILITNTKGKIKKEILLPVRFVPFTRE